jgi:hypothetical protein
MFFNKDTTKQRKITTSHSDILYVYALLFLMGYTSAGYIAPGMTGEIEKRQWFG